MPNCLLHLMAIMVSIALPCVCIADDGPGQPTAKVLDTSGQVHKGRIKELSSDSVTIQTADKLIELPFANVLRIDQLKALPVARTRWLVILANGDRLYVDSRPNAIQIDDLQLTGRLLIGGESIDVVIPLETIRGIVMRVPESSTELSRILKQMESSQENSDVFVLQAGDRVVGEYRQLGPQGFELTVDSAKTNLKVESVQWMRINPELVSPPETDGPTVLVRLTDDTGFTVTQMKWWPTGPGIPIARAELKAAFGALITVPVNCIASIQPLGFGPVYLSDLKPVEYKFTPFLSRKWAYQLDRCVNGGPLQVDSIRFDKGVGLHSRCRLTYELGQRFSGFRAVVDLDDSASRLGHAVCTVELDGRPTWSSGPLTKTSPPVTVRMSTSARVLDVSNCKRLTIVVDFGARGDIQDHVDFLDAVLIP